jgi:hypothetical protein
LAKKPFEKTSVGKGPPMDSRTTLERLACDTEDWEAMLSLYEKNFLVFEKGIEKHFQGTAPASQVLFTLVFHVALRAKYFLPDYDEPDEWLEQEIDLECESLLRSLSAMKAGMRN